MSDDKTMEVVKAILKAARIRTKGAHSLEDLKELVESNLKRIKWEHIEAALGFNRADHYVKLTKEQVLPVIFGQASLEEVSEPLINMVSDSEDSSGSEYSPSEECESEDISEDGDNSGEDEDDEEEEDEDAGSEEREAALGRLSRALCSFYGFEHETPATVEELLREATELEHLRKTERAAAAVCLAQCYLDGKGVERDIQRAAQRMGQLIMSAGNKTKLAESIHTVALAREKLHNDLAMAMNHVSSDLGCGTATRWIAHRAEPSMKAFWFEKAAQQGDILALVYLGDYAAHRRSHDKAVALYRQVVFQHGLVKSSQSGAAYAGAKAMYKLAMCYFSGKGVAVDEDAGTHLLTMASDAGIGDAMYELAKKSHPPKSVQLMEKAAGRGHEEAAYTLGTWYKNGINVPKDLVKSYGLFKQASDADHPEATYLLAMAYDEGAGVEQDFKKAAEHFEKASQLGNHNATYILANYYAEGLGVPMDEDKAEDLFEKAAEGGVHD